MAPNLALTIVVTLNRFNGVWHLPKYNKKMLGLGNVMITRTNKTSSRNEESLPSFLYVPKGKANKLVSVLSPAMDWTFSPSEIQELKENLKVRRKQEVDVDRLAELWNQRKVLSADVQRVETAREQNVDLIRQKLESKTTGDVEPLLKEGRRLRRASKAAGIALDELEVRLIPQLLQLPNILHPKTPMDVPQIAKVHGLRPTFNFKPRDHTQIGLASNQLRFTDVGIHGYYLEGRCAVAELATLDFFAQQFSEAGFVPFSNPDFCKPIVVEGCGHRLNDPSKTFHLRADEQSRSSDVLELSGLHLVGSASHQPFCAYHAKCSVDERHLPLRYFTTGRYYAPPAIAGQSPNLFQTSQSSRLHFFIAVTAEDATEIYDQCVCIVEEAYTRLDVHFRTVHVAAESLLDAECRRTDIQMWSTSSQAYCSVASISACGEYISKRLWMCYKKQHGTKRGFLQVVHGTAVSFSDFLACLMESTQRLDSYEVVFSSALHPFMSNYGTNE